MRTSVFCGLVALLLTLASAQPALSGGDRRLIVKLHADGDHAVLECAAKLHAQGRDFATATRDGSPSLDRLRDRYAIRETRPLFRRGSDGGSFDRQRRDLRERIEAMRRPGSTRHEPPPELAHVYVVEIGGESSVEEAVQAFGADPHVAWAQVDQLNDLDGWRRDPFLDSEGTWLQPYADLWGLHRIRAESAWGRSRGDGVVVAVVDTGLDYLHPDIEANVFVHPGEDLNGNGRADPEEWNGLDDDGNGFVDDLLGFDFANSIDANGDGDYDDPGDRSDPDPWDDHGHGTHVAGTIAAVEGNGIGIAGVAPGARIMALKGFPESGPGRDSVLWRAVLYAVENGARVINTSWSCRGRCPSNPLAEEMVELVRALGGVIVTSAGNDASQVAFKSPENRYGTIAVGSSGEDDGLSRNFSNFGLGLDVVAPGGDPTVIGGPFILASHKNILSLRAEGSGTNSGPTVAERYARNAGTSMAAPHVSGVVALLLGADPDLRFEQIKTALHLGAVDLGEAGHDPTFGAGRLDAEGALEAVSHSDAQVEFVAPLPMSILDPLVGRHRVEVQVSGGDLVDAELAFGRGLAPSSWTPIEWAEAGALDGARAAWWSTKDLTDGTYTLRLRGRLRDDREVDTYLPVGLERHGPIQISEGPGAEPVVSRRRVVYGVLDPDTRETDLRLVDLRDRVDRLVVGGPGDQRAADLSGRLLAWAEGGRSQTDAPIQACRLRGRDETCEPFSVASGATIRETPVVHRGSVYWGEFVGPKVDLLQCRVEPSGRRCVTSVFQSSARWHRSVAAFGRLFAWISAAAGDQRAEYCVLDRHSGECNASPVLASVPISSKPAVGDDLLAWEAFGATGGEVWLCALDPETGACPARRIAERALEARPRLSGRRLVYSATDEAGDRAVWMCEWDAVLATCPIQRLTGGATSATRPDIDADLVVWEDDRLGETHIFGTYLPTLAPIGPRTARVGEPLWIPLRADHRGHSAPRLEARMSSGRGLDSVDARLIEWPRSGRAAIWWRADSRHLGVHQMTVTARSATGLVSKETIEIRVEARPTRPKRRVGGGNRFVD